MVAWQRFRRWLSWRRIGAVGLLGPLLALTVLGAWNGPGDVAGGAGTTIMLLIGGLFAALLVAVIRRRDDLETPQARRNAFLRDHAPAPDDIVCLFQGDFAADLSSVIVDRAADRIVFDRCHAPHGAVVVGNERRFSCPVGAIEGIMLPRQATVAAGGPRQVPPSRRRQDSLPLVVITPEGRATIPADADGLAALVAFLEQRAPAVPHPAVDRPETQVAMLGGALAGMAAASALASAVVPGLSDAGFAWSFLGGAVAGAFALRGVLGVVDRWFGVDLAGPVGGAVKGATIAIQAAVPICLVASSAGADWAWPWLAAAVTSLGALVGAAFARRRVSTSSVPSISTPATLGERLATLAGAPEDGVAQRTVRECLVAQWQRRSRDSAAYVGDLLHALVREAHADGRGGAWRPEVEVADGEVLVRCGWTDVGQRASTRTGDADAPAETLTLLRAILDLVAVLRDSPQAPYRLVVEFPRAEGVAALVRTTHPDPATCRRLGFDDEGRLVVAIREIAPSPASLPLPPLADVLRPKPRAERSSEEPDDPPSRERIAE